MNVSDFLVQRLAEWGVERIYGYPGDGINGILGALGSERGDQSSSSRPATRRLAAFMACGHAKFTGEVGVCLATSGPGAIHLLNGLYDAKLDHQPVVAIVGQQARAALGGSYQQEVDLLSLFKDVAHEYVHMVTEPDAGAAPRRPGGADRARRAHGHVPHPPERRPDARGRRAAAARARHDPLRHRLPAAARRCRASAELDRAADGAQRRRAGRDARRRRARCGATDEVIEVAELLGAGVAKALLGKAAVPDDLPFVTGSIGLLGTKPS